MRDKPTTRNEPTTRDVVEAMLLFHSGGAWDERKQREWRRITGGDDATTRALCDLGRRSLADEPRADAMLRAREGK